MGISYGFEGNEGGGKTTLHLLTTMLLEKTTGFPILARREPGGTPLGEEIRPILRDEKFKHMHAITNTLLYSAARSEGFFNLEKPFLDKNKNGILLKDRTWLSTIALQTVDGADIDYIMDVQRPFMSIPEKFIIIDIPVEETIVRMYAEYKRRNSGREPDWRDKQDIKTLDAIRQNYLNFAIKNKEKCLVVDCFDEPWKKAAEICLDMIKTLGLRDEVYLDNSEIDMQLNKFTQVAKDIVDTNMTRVHSSPEGYLKTFDIDGFRVDAEAARSELNFPSREELQSSMHNEWRNLGIESYVGGRERR